MHLWRTGLIRSSRSPCLPRPGFVPYTDRPDRPALAGVADTIREEYEPILNVLICRETGKELKRMSFGGAAVDGFELIGVPRGRLQQVRLPARLFLHRQ